MSFLPKGYKNTPKGARTHYSPAGAGISARTRKRVQAGLRGITNLNKFRSAKRRKRSGPAKWNVG